MPTAPDHPEPHAGLAKGKHVAQPSSGSEASQNDKAALASLGAELLRRASESQPAMEAAWDELLASWGVAGEPIGLRDLRGMIQEESGTSSEDNAFTRELIALRADRRP